MQLRNLFTNNIFKNNSIWILNNKINGYQYFNKDQLATQLDKGIIIRIIYSEFKIFNDLRIKKRIFIQSLNDGYFCWVNYDDIVAQNCKITYEKYLTNKNGVVLNVEKLMDWIKFNANKYNSYLWGGTIGPHFDCSGFVQRAFLSQNIWLPRDANQQEIFTKAISFESYDLNKIETGDLIFFGTKEKCNHVGIYYKDGFYWHCSGIENGRNGIGLDNLTNSSNRISSYYKSLLRTIGKVNKTFKWDKILR